MSSRSANLRYHEAVHGVYFDDLDALGILHNARYVLLVERTIGSFWQRVNGGGSAAPSKRPDWFQLVRTNSIEYLKPVEGTGEVRVRVWLEKLGTTSLTFGFCVMPMDLDVDHAVGTRVMVCVDPQSRKPAPWSEAFRQQVDGFVRRAA
ncbi:MAG: acyl-CoA thioesterase [Archangium sp.]|nr:acyl-CoA thioesterase [Archangium sp.]